MNLFFINIDVKCLQKSRAVLSLFKKSFKLKVLKSVPAFSVIQRAVLPIHPLTLQLSQ